MNRWAVKKAIKEEMQLDPGLISNLKREQAIDAAADEMAALGVWDGASEFFPATSSTALPATCSTLNRVYWNGRRLLKLDRATAPSATTTGEPGMWWTDLDPADNLLKAYLYPLPGSAGILSLRFTARAATPIPTAEEALPNGQGADVADLTTYGIPAGWHSALVDGAVMHCHRKNGNYAAMNVYRQSFSEKLNQLLIKALEQRNANPSTNEEERPAKLGGDIFQPPEL